MRRLSTLATQTADLVGRALSAIMTLLVAVAIIPVRVAMVESQWFTDRSGRGTTDPTEALLDSSWHFKPRRPEARSRPAPDPADPPG